jgi:hypothetical protein
MFSFVCSLWSLACFVFPPIPSLNVVCSLLSPNLLCVPSCSFPHSCLFSTIPSPVVCSLLFLPSLLFVLYYSLTYCFVLYCSPSDFVSYCSLTCWLLSCPLFLSCFPLRSVLASLVPSLDIPKEESMADTS